MNQYKSCYVSFYFEKLYKSVKVEIWLTYGEWSVGVAIKLLSF